MVIDLRKCVGCGACSVICDQTNKVSFNKWRRVFDCGVGKPPERRRMCLPISCMHCANPPCLAVCPTTATRLRPDGIVDIAYELCIGCGYCIVACPYAARSIVFEDEYAIEMRAVIDESSTAESGRDRVGVCTKCNFCHPRIDLGLTKGLIPGRDPSATPMCVNTCAAHALHFGDLDDSDSDVAGLIREYTTVRLQEVLGTNPSVFYIVE